MPIWTLATIKEKIRETTGRRTIGQLSESELEAFIDEYYTLTMPRDLSIEEFNEFWTKDTVASTETITLDDDVLFLRPPYTIGAYPLEVTEDPVNFYGKYSKVGEPYDEDRPVMALYLGRTLTFRPAPDGVYQFHSAAVVIPAALTVSGVPLMDAWGRLIVLGTSILIYGSAGQREEAGDLQGGYEYQRILVQRPGLIKMMDYRGQGRF